jgi:pimeloyl-ACP methyl ester carboxylesterase
MSSRFGVLYRELYRAARVRGGCYRRLSQRRLDDARDGSGDGRGASAWSTSGQGADRNRPQLTAILWGVLFSIRCLSSKDAGHSGTPAFPVVDHVRTYEGPVLVIWGEGDTIVPPDQSLAVAQAAPRSSHVVIAGADHNDTALLDGEEFVEAVVGFLAENT